uniref:Girdin-like n=1 Tax=Dermatophagoides pteronyssinus TaxID=6956 RepID=A0A6P6YDL8_DERPT|nr:girdin-like [Dermatophagoides pteronyssinus]
MMSIQQQLRTSFMQSPLVTWLKTLLDENCNDYDDLCKGFYLNKAWLQIDSNPLHIIQDSISSTTTTTSAINTEIANSSKRIKNLNILLQNIKNFYQNVLDQLLVLRLPDVTRIAFQCNDELWSSSISQNNSLFSLMNQYYQSSSTSSSSTTTAATTSTSTTTSTYNYYDDLQTLLLLILGCAVQCEHKEIFIEKIKQLDISVQHSIVECIQQITDNPESVFLMSEWNIPPDDEEEKERIYMIMVGLINRLTNERDQLYQRVVDLSSEMLSLTIQANQFDQSSSNNSSLQNNNNSVNHCDQKSHYLVELADVKSKLRRLQQELEEKNEIITELKETIEQNKEFYNKLRHDNLELTQEARTAKAYRDEIDVLNERCRKIDRLEAEVQRYRDKINELDYCKTRVEELREDNRILGETKTMLEDQLESSRKRVEKIPELEEKILKLTTHGNELNLQRELDKNQIERLIEEISHLRLEKKFTNEEFNRIQQELTDLRAQMRLNHETIMKNEEGNLYDQINQDASKRLLKLEHENKKLQTMVDDYQNNYIDIDSVLSLFQNIDSIAMNKCSKAKQDDDETLSETNESGYDSNVKSKIEKLSQIKEWIGRINLNYVQMKTKEMEKNVLEKENDELKTRLRDISAKFDMMEKNFTQTISENQKNQRIIEQKTKKLQEYQSELELIENENQKLMSNADSLRLSLKKLNDLEIEMTNLETEKQRFEQENKSLEKEINRLKTSIDFKDKIIDDNSGKLSTFELENKRLKKEMEMNWQLGQRLKDVEKENKDLINASAVQRKTLTTLQRDLVEEKLKTEKFAEEFTKIVETLNRLCEENYDNNELRINSKDIYSLINGQVSTAINDTLQSLIEKYSTEKDSHIEELQARLADLKDSNQEMQNLINSLKRQLNIDEKSDIKSSLDSLNELQRRIFALEDENHQLKTDLNQQKDNQMEIAIRNDMIESKLQTLNESNAELKNKNATLEVENSLLKSQNSSLESQTIELQEQMVAIQDSIEKLKIKCEEYETAHRLLINDNESLQEIHQQLTVDYENLTKIHGTLKQSYKKLKNDYKTMEEKLNVQMTKYDELMKNADEELQTLRLEMEKNSQPTKENVDHEEKFLSLNNEYKILDEEYKRLQTEHKMLQNIYKKLRSDNNDLKLKHTELQGETAECKDRMNALNVEVSKLSNYCEMVAMTNTTLEQQRKKLATQSASLLAQYNDLLMELSCGCERTIKDKLHELIIKKERLEKMFKDYDISFEKNMSRVSNNKSSNNLHQTSSSSSNRLDDSIYGLLWEAETPSIHSDSKFFNSSALLRQYSINNEKDQKIISSPRIPPRNLHTLQRYPPIGINTKETTTTTTSCIEFVPIENKMSINISSRNNQQQQQGNNKSLDNHSIIDGTFSKLQITSTSPFQIAKSISTISSPVSSSSSTTNNHFMRGSFKSNSVNYGNLMRKSEPINMKMLQNNNKYSSQQQQPQQQVLCLSSNRVRVNNNNNQQQQQQQKHHQLQRNFNPMSPLSFHSDNSSSSSSTTSSHNHDIMIDKDQDIVVGGSGGGSLLITSSSNNNPIISMNNNVSTRSRITITSDSIQTISNGFNTNSNNLNLINNDNNNISIQISNAMNNNNQNNLSNNNTITTTETKESHLN